MRPIVLTLAGSDPSAGAGIQADIKTIEACGGFATSAVTAITVQDGQQLSRCEPLPADLVRDQARAVLSQLPVAAVKSGMLGTGEVVCEVARLLRTHRPEHYVCDPVLRAGSGRSLLNSGALELLREELLPLATLVTPNIPELEALTDRDVPDLAAARHAAWRLLDGGVPAVLVKGGHLKAERGIDLLITADLERRFDGEWIENGETHGTGCAYSAAIATYLACGRGLEDAIRHGKELVIRAIRYRMPAGGPAGLADPFGAPPAASHGGAG